MGNSSSSHQPLERGFTRGTYGDIKNVVCIHISCISFCHGNTSIRMYTGCTVKEREIFESMKRLYT